MIVIIANALNIAEKVKNFQECDWRGIQRNDFFFIYYNVTIFFHLQSNLKSKDVVLNQIITGSMTVSGTFYKNKLPDHERKLCLCADTKYSTAVRRGRQDDSQLGSIFEELFL